MAVAIFTVACQSDSSSDNQKDGNDIMTTQDNMDQSTSNPDFDVNFPDQNTPPQPQEGPQQVNIPAGPDGVVHHYICVDQCAGGHSEGPGNCPVCSKTLAHNQAWHDAQNQGAQQTQPNQFGPRSDGAPDPQIQTPNPSEQPQQVNIPAGADGIVHHYVCVDGCVGGHSEGPGTCPGCNKTLAHNQAWHNQ